MWSLESPLALLLFLAMAPLIYLAHVRRRRGGRLLFNLGVWRADSFRHGPTLRGLLLLGGRVLFWAGFGLLILATAGPVLVEKKRGYLSRGVDVVIALDASPSMSAQDVGPESRFEAAKRVIRSFLADWQNGAVGLLAFGKEAALKVPPTLDTGYLDAALENTRVMELGDGTAIGTALALAALHLKDSRAREKLIILITDGDNNAGGVSPRQAAEVAAGLGIRIYAIGIGSEGETTLEFTDPETGKQVRGTYQGRLNEELLKAVASISRGLYFYSGTPGTLAAVFAEIDGLEKTEAEVTVYVERKPLHRTFILAGLAALLFSVLLGRFLLQELL
jgi:Ca-activated chloride channel family protein